MAGWKGRLLKVRGRCLRGRVQLSRVSRGGRGEAAMISRKDAKELRRKELIKVEVSCRVFLEADGVERRMLRMISLRPLPRGGRCGKQQIEQFLYERCVKRQSRTVVIKRLCVFISRRALRENNYHEKKQSIPHDTEEIP
jgi:hypothetical protein